MGLSSVPPKVVKEIVNREYVDMWELLPNSWQVEAEGSCCHTKHPCRSTLTNISIWTECFASMAAILVVAYLDKASHFFLYLRTITKASRTFEGSTWVSYDMPFRCQVANCGSLDWGTVNVALYNQAYASKVKYIPWCQYCLSDTQSSQECPLPNRNNPVGEDAICQEPLARAWTHTLQ